jgi:hypothetical protein
LNNFTRISRYILIFIIIESFSLFAQEENKFPAIETNDVAGIKILNSKYYDGNALWGLIDGGADIYLEYGFDKLLFQEVEVNKIKFRVEIYKMLSEQSAFGIFSVSQFKCTQDDTLTKFICLTQYQVQAAVGRYYISISNERGNLNSKNSMIDIFVKILSKTNETIFDRPEMFKKDLFALHLSKLKFMKGTLGLQNGFPNMLDLFDGYSNYNIFILPIETKDGYINISDIVFSNEADKIKFHNDAVKKLHDKEKIMSSIPTPTELIFVETTLPDNENKKYFDTIFTN